MDEETIKELKLKKSILEMEENAQLDVEIVSGNGDFTIVSSVPDVATAEISGHTITVISSSNGSATLTIEDAADKMATLEVNVSSTIDTGSPRFVWEGTVELDKANNWGTTAWGSRVVITNTQKGKQFILSWTGGLVAGSKSSPELKIVEKETPSQTITLTSLEVLEEENGNYPIIFTKDSENGELVFSK